MTEKDNDISTEYFEALRTLLDKHPPKEVLVIEDSYSRRGILQYLERMKAMRECLEKTFLADLEKKWKEEQEDETR